MQVDAVSDFESAKRDLLPDLKNANQNSLQQQTIFARNEEVNNSHRFSQRLKLHPTKQNN